ncbi:hypothetical protein [Nannocystis punicea]|uniref:Lipoprotein n=1 Tax=Nannocystis punicea TaxID=2995304 RepID=A0ABY7GS23_9BACT|nr:hypothetical protein [Nannocystis poenicansa]WAS89723.1 hypothetical protein O0S08_26320 [Nannocystis poenicansa]
MRTDIKVVSGLAAGAVVVAFAVCTPSQRPTPSKLVPADSAAANAQGARTSGAGLGLGVSAQPYDPANIHPLDWPPNADARLRETAAAGVDLIAEFDGGKAQWSDTLLSVNSPNFQRLERKQCAADVGEASIGECALNIKMAVRRTGPKAGEIAFAQAELEHSEHPGCEQFSACLMEHRVGATIPLPAGDEDLLGMSQRLVMQRPNSASKDPAALQASVDTLAEDLARAREMGLHESDDPKVLYAFRMQEEAMKFLIERQKEGSGG